VWFGTIHQLNGQHQGKQQFMFFKQGTAHVGVHVVGEPIVQQQNAVNGPFGFGHASTDVIDQGGGLQVVGVNVGIFRGVIVGLEKRECERERESARERMHE
jgi:hypothetical protein